MFLCQRKYKAENKVQYVFGSGLLLLLLLLFFVFFVVVLTLWQADKNPHWYTRKFLRRSILTWKKISKCNGFKKNLKAIYNQKPDFFLRLHVKRYLQYVVVKLIDSKKFRLVVWRYHLNYILRFIFS